MNKKIIFNYMDYLDALYYQNTDKLQTYVWIIINYRQLILN